MTPSTNITTTANPTTNSTTSNAVVPIVSVAPIVLPAPGRVVDLHLRVSAPVSGSELPVIVFSHGHGSSNNLSSLNGYAPLVNAWASRGFVVIQPTHLSSKTLHTNPNVDPNGPEGPLFWRSRAQDMHRILDDLARMEDLVPEIRGRVDRRRVAVAGHSLGGLTAGMLLGERVTDEHGVVVDMRDSRVTAGVLLAAPGGGAKLSGAAAQRFPILRTTDFSAMTTQALVVVGDQDVNPQFSERVDYRADAYALSPAPKSLLEFFGAGHILGGISGYDADETSDESPERVEAVARLTSDYLRSALHPDDPAWAAAVEELARTPQPLARVEHK